MTGRSETRTEEHSCVREEQIEKEREIYLPNKLKTTNMANEYNDGLPG